MRILVYPHAMELGGSQLNAIELAGAVRDRGHEVTVVSEDGPLVARVEALGLPHVRGVRARRRPSPGRVRQLRDLVREGGHDVVHGYEWPPILEAWLATRGRSAQPFGTVMSMGVADFIPGSMPLVVGTKQLADGASRTRTGRTHLMEPPVDTEANRPGASDHAVPGLPPAAPGTLTVVIVSRVVKELKLEGILTAVRSIEQLATRHAVRLVIVGGGAELGVVAAEANRVNARFVTPVVVLTGEVQDPRGAYAAADVCIGMGGSALRSLAFAKPLVVQGEGGFFRTLSPESLPLFLEQGFYGVDRLDEDAAVAALSALLEPLLRDAHVRRELGGWGRELVLERFSLHSAAARLERWYVHVLASGEPGGRRELLVSGRRFARYKLERLQMKARRRAPTDDFNARPL